ncbi:MAG: C-terminal helicase domain-containing protein, partial [Desulfobacteraceae bacterium]|nr:C-terminal helicase domain-containing protein [Desulfobacteraceae bacterium]
FVEMDDKRFFLRKFINDNPDAKILVFVRTRVRAERVAKALERGNIKALTIHGEKDQQARSSAMKQFKNDWGKILIATDVSARGIDIPDIHYVINYDLPEISENYVHRVGRTGRGVKKGIAISYCSKEEKKQLEDIQTFLNKKIETIPLSKKEYTWMITPENEPESVLDLIKEQETFEKKKKKRKKKK